MGRIDFNYFALVALVLVGGLSACGLTESPLPATSTPPMYATSDASGPGDSPIPTATSDVDPFAGQRQAMVLQQIKARGVTDEAVLTALLNVPRHEFVPADYQSQSYDDHPLPIGYGQTISQPYIVAVMTELIALQPGDKVLEIGTGSGYQAAVLAEITDEVYTIEIIPELADRAQVTFDRLDYGQIETKQADGYWGWEEYAPFAAIIVTAAPDHVPQPLVKQLADGGKMVIPVGPPGGYQSLWLIERKGEEILRTNWGGVRFVPLTRSE